MLTLSRLAAHVRLRTLLMLLCALALITAAQVLHAPTAMAVSSKTYEADVIKYANVQRAKHHLVKVKAKSCVDKYAEKQAKAMAKKKKLYHQDLRVILKKCKLKKVGENVAYGYTSGKKVTAAWMKSSGHRKNILTKGYRQIGVGAYKDSKGRWWVSEVFGQPR